LRRENLQEKFSTEEKFPACITKWLENRRKISLFFSHKSRLKIIFSRDGIVRGNLGEGNFSRRNFLGGRFFMDRKAKLLEKQIKKAIKKKF